MTHWDTALPHPLSKLHELEFDYANGEGMDFEPYSAFLTANETCVWFRAWTGNKEVDGAEFRIFGQDGTGGYAAFWLVDSSRSLLDQPVVFLGSEGEKGVVAANFQDYLWLLAGGIGPCEAVSYPGLKREPNTAFTKFANEYSSTGAQQPDAVLVKAKKAYPMFVERLDSLCR